MHHEHEAIHDHRAALCLVLAGVCAALHIWKLPPALPALQAELGLDLVASGFLLSIVQLGGMALGLLVGLMAERVGLRRSIMAGLAILAAASSMGAYFDTAAMMLFFRAIEGFGFLMVAMPAPALIRRLVPPSNLSRILGLWSAHMPVATVLILTSGAWLLSFMDWRLLWLLLSALSLAMLAVVWTVIPADPSAVPAQIKVSPAKTPNPKTPIGAMVFQTLGSRRVWLVALTFGMYSAQWMAVIGFLPTIYAAAGVAGTTAGLLTGLVAGANIGGNLAAGQLLHRGVAAHRLIVTGFLAMILCAYAAFGAGLPPGARFAAIVAFSAIGGLIPATLFVLAMQVAPSPRTTTATVGWMQQCSSTGQFSGPPVVAWLVDFAGDWQWMWLATGAYATAGIGLAVILGHSLRPAQARLPNP